MEQAVRDHIAHAAMELIIHECDKLVVAKTGLRGDSETRNATKIMARVDAMDAAVREVIARLVMLNG